MLAWGLGLGVSVLVTAAAYPAAAKAAGQSIAQMGKDAQVVAGWLSFLTGPLERLDTIAGYVSYKIFPTVTILLAIYGAIQGAQVLRGAEVRGWFDLWFSAGLTRARIARDRIAAFLVSLAVILVFLYLGSVIGGLATGESFVRGIGQCAAVGLISLFAFALSLLLSQFFATTRVPSGAASAFMVAAYFLANTYQSLGALSFVGYVSPFYYYLKMRTLVPGLTFSLGAMLVLLVPAVVMIAVALRLYLGRDSNGVVIQRQDGGQPKNYTFRPSRLSRRTLWLNWIAEQPVAIISWSLGIGVFAFVEASVVPAALKLLGAAKGPLRKLLEQSGFISTDAALSLLMTFTAALVAGFVVFQVARWASDATQKRNDAILVQPVSMVRFVLSRLGSLIVMAAVVALASVAGTYVGALAGHYSIHIDGLARVVGVTVLFAFGLGGVGLLLVTLFRSSAATAIFGGLLVASYFLDLFKALFNWPSWVMHASVFNAYSGPGTHAPYMALPATGDLVFLLVLGIAGGLVAWGALHRGIRVTA